MNIHRKAIPMPGATPPARTPLARTTDPAVDLVPVEEPKAEPLEGEVVNVELWTETDSGEYHVAVRESPPADYVAREGEEFFLPWSAYLKADGCVDLRRAYGPSDDDEEDYMHICDLAEFVEQMKALLQVQKRHKFPLY